MTQHPTGRPPKYQWRKLHIGQSIILHCLPDTARRQAYVAARKFKMVLRTTKTREGMLVRRVG